MRWLVLLVAVLATVLASSSLASGDQRGGGSTAEPFAATGIIVKPEATAYQYGTHAMTDEASGTDYALTSETVPLDDYVGERVRVHGTLELEEGELEGGPALINVTRLERDPAGSTIENSVRGYVTDVSRSARVVVVEEDPSDEAGSAKGEFALTQGTAILRRQDGDRVPAAFDDLRIGQLVEANYAGPVAESYPTQGIAGSIVILDGDRAGSPGGNGSGGPAVLPDTGGAALLVPGIIFLLIAGGSLARRAAGSSSRQTRR